MLPFQVGASIPLLTIDHRLEQVSQRKAPVDEVMRVTEQYRHRHTGWSAKHFFAWYRREGGERSYTWVKSRLQESALVVRAKRRGAHRKRRDRSPWPGLVSDNYPDGRQDS